MRYGAILIRVLRSQLEQYIEAQLGSEHLLSKKAQTELRAINKEIAECRKKLTALEARKAEIERAMKTSRANVSLVSSHIADGEPMASAVCGKGSNGPAAR